MKNLLILFVTAVIFSLISCKSNQEDLSVSTSEPTMSEKMAMNSKTEAAPDKKRFTDFIYGVGPKYGAVKMETVQNARSISDFIHEEELSKIASLKAVTVNVLDRDMLYNNSERGTTASFTEAQLKLLQSLDYSTSLMVLVEFTELKKNGIEHNYTSPYLTIVPEKQATYMFSEDTLKDYLRVNTEKARVDVDPEKLQAAKIYFTITKTGKVENVRLDRTSFYPKVDETMISLMKNLPGSWTPAENTKGEKVAQELVVSFGLMGC